MGITPPTWNDGRLPERVTAFNYLVEHHYRHYQFYALCGAPHKANYAHLVIMRTSRGPGEPHARGFVFQPVPLPDRYSA